MLEICYGLQIAITGAFEVGIQHTVQLPNPIGHKVGRIGNHIQPISGQCSYFIPFFLGGGGGGGEVVKWEHWLEVFPLAKWEHFQ